MQPDMENFEDISLDMATIQEQIEKESRFAGELITSEYRISTGEFIRRQWHLSWKKLIDDTGFPTDSFHNLPDANRPVRGSSRRRMSYTQQVEAFAILGIKGKTPEDFLGVRCWLQEAVTPGQTPQYDKRWWKPVALYVEGQPFPGEQTDTSVDAPVTESTNNISDDGNSHLLDLINGKSQRQAVTAISRDSIIATTPEVIANARNGTLFDELIEKGLLTEEGGVFKVVA